VDSSRYRPWAELLKRTFGIDLETCPRCGGRMRLLAVITDLTSAARFLRHRGEPTEPHGRSLGGRQRGDAVRRVRMGSAGLTEVPFAKSNNVVETVAPDATEKSLANKHRRAHRMPQPPLHEFHPIWRARFANATGF
jgi:hypothetical protein